MSDVLDAAVAADNYMLGSHAQVEGRAQSSVIDDDRHPDAELLPIRTYIVYRVVETGIDCNHRQIRACRFIRPFEVRHLLAARYAPGCPKLEVDGLLSVETAEVDCLPIDRLEDHPRSRRADKIVPGGFGSLLTTLSVRRSADQYG